jgi:dienelactone hydrolase
MKQTLLALFAAIAFGATAAHGQAPPPSPATITFQSATYNDFRQVLTRQAPTASVSIHAKLEFPEQGRDRYPAVIVVHSLGGYREANEGYFAAELRKAGYATLTYDSFAARGTTGQVFSSSPGYLTAGVADAFVALRWLASEPRIDPGRIAILGFSYGGDVAHLTAFEPLRAALDPGSLRFAAHVAFYPAGSVGVIADGGGYTGSPVLMMLGGKDDNLPVAKIENYLAYAQAAGHPAPIELVIYPGAYHAWTVSDAPPLRFYPELVSTKKCPIILFGSGPPKILVGGETRPFDPGTYSACLREAPGYSLAYDAAVRAQSLADAQRFLARNLRR